MTLLFYYTLLIMFFYTIVAATSLSAFYVSHRRTFLYATLGFTFYFFDVSLVFKDNFITPDAVFEAASFYDVGHPYTSIITGGGAFLFLWLAACRYCREERPVVRFAPVALWAALSLAAYQLIENPQWREFVYYNLRAVLQLLCYALLAWWYTHSPDPERRSIMKSHRTAFFWAIGLTCGIILENVYVQLIFDPGSIPRGMWVLAERSPMENLLFICYGLAVLRGASVSLQLRARELPEGDDPLLAESIDRLLPLYSRTYDLSKREEEVLRHALMGKDNQNIASVLTLSAGTVKVLTPTAPSWLPTSGSAERACVDEPPSNCSRSSVISVNSGKKPVSERYNRRNSLISALSDAYNSRFAAKMGHFVNRRGIKPATPNSPGVFSDEKQAQGGSPPFARFLLHLENMTLKGYILC